MDDVSLGKPICNLREHIKKLFQKTKCGLYGENGFDLEFATIEKRTERELYHGDYRSALKHCNRDKNRYSNVLPLEKSRVVLNTVDGIEGSDYINASFVRGESAGSETYICTQGPLQNTVNDFWRMIWEQDCNIIVMLTKEIENLKVKCARYWPEKEPRVCGNIRVSVLSEDTLSEIIIRTFALEDIHTGVGRTVIHYQYVSWPDHGLPVSTTAFLELVRMVDKQKRTGPIVVHCSAGIGRSGTFCTVHNVITKYRHDVSRSETPPVFNIMQTVIYMRGQRPGMVQTKEQYMFCCLSIEEETSYLSKSLKGAYFEPSPQRERSNSRRRQQEEDLFSEELSGVGVVAGCFV